MSLDKRSVLEVIRDGSGQWDTRRIHIELGFRGVDVEPGFLGELDLLSEEGLIERVNVGRQGTGPHWGITKEGEQFLLNECR